MPLDTSNHAGENQVRKRITPFAVLGGIFVVIVVGLLFMPSRRQHAVREALSYIETLPIASQDIKGVFSKGLPYKQTYQNAPEEKKSEIQFYQVWDPLRTKSSSESLFLEDYYVPGDYNVLFAPTSKSGKWRDVGILFYAYRGGPKLDDLKSILRSLNSGFSPAMTQAVKKLSTRVSDLTASERATAEAEIAKCIELTKGVEVGEIYAYGYDKRVRKLGRNIYEYWRHQELLSGRR